MVVEYEFTVVVPILFVQLKHDLLSTELAEVVVIANVNWSELADYCERLTGTMCPEDGF